MSSVAKGQAPPYAPQPLKPQTLHPLRRPLNGARREVNDRPKVTDGRHVESRPVVFNPGLPFCPWLSSAWVSRQMKLWLTFGYYGERSSFSSAPRFRPVPAVSRR